MSRTKPAPAQRPRGPIRPARPSGPAGPGLALVPGFVTADERAAVLTWLATLRPLWELRFSERRPLPAGETQRMLKRPVYWLGNWQFACLGYYHPPHGERHRCVAAEPFPPVLDGWVSRIEAMARRTLPAALIPPGWRLDTCLVNLYGDGVDARGRREDRAKVGAHRDFEPGPVASVSLGARALFQFTDRRGGVVREQWLEDRSLQVFAGPTYKDRLWHRVQRVDRKGPPLPPAVDGFTSRRVNFTFRHVPPGAVCRFAALPAEVRDDVRGYVSVLAGSSPFWAAELAAEPAGGDGAPR